MEDLLVTLHRLCSSFSLLSNISVFKCVLSKIDIYFRVLISIGSSILTKPNSCLVVALWGNINFIVINSTRIFPENTVTAPCYMFTLLTSVIVRYNFQTQVNKNEYLTIITSAKSILQFDLLPPWRKNVTYILSSTKLKPISY